MSDYTFKVDEKMTKEIESLKKFFKLASRAELLKLGIALLKVARKIEKEKGKLVAQKGKEKVIIKLV